MREHSNHRTAQTAGRCWDGGLQVYDHPIPRWWLALPLAALALALLYWLLYPSWPLPGGHFEGLLKIELSTPDGQVRVPWSGSAQLQSSEENNELRIQRRRLNWGMSRADYHTIVGDPRMLAFALAAARVPYLDNCAACHASDGRGVAGLGPGLADLPARTAGDFALIEHSIRQDSHGRAAGVVGAGSGPLPRAVDAMTIAGGCTDCHASRPAAAGDVAHARGGAEPGVAVQAMPSWGGRLSDIDIKALTVYVQQLGSSARAD